jgi:hypothetical protein
MESKVVSSPVSDPSVEAPRSEQESRSGVDALAEIRQAILADCRFVPLEYLEEIRMAASGE